VSVSTRTMDAANEVLGTGSQAAGNGGSSGTTSRSILMALIRMHLPVSPTRSDALLSLS
jgi:hypothetical protein